MTFDGPWIPPQTHELGTPDGRVLRYCLYGPADGVPVIAHHGTPGTRWERPDVIEAIEEAGLRVLLHGRPGFGSTRQPAALSRMSPRTYDCWPTRRAGSSSR
jgi:pimeloyl-ACP methyl ester carboxylesterase